MLGGYQVFELPFSLKNVGRTKIFWRTSHGFDGDFLGREDPSEEAWVARRWPALTFEILWYDRQTIALSFFLSSLFLEMLVNLNPIPSSINRIESKFKVSSKVKLNFIHYKVSLFIQHDCAYDLSDA